MCRFRVQPVNTGNTFVPSSQDSYGSPIGNVISQTPQTFSSSNPNNDIGNVAVSSSLSFGGNSVSPNNYNTANSNGVVSSVINPRLKPTNSPGFSPLTLSTFDQASAQNPPKRNVLSPGQLASITLNDLNTLRTNSEQLLLQESRGQQVRQSVRLVFWITCIRKQK